ncbi:valine--tRNA ligase [Candidatus Woesearchaeota archaeon]|nr:valine--tRNA ligase [Candidatus Woesearchaeota archaeon]
MELSKHYNHKEREKEIQEFWIKNKIYKFNPKSKLKIFSIDTPPPTVSGIAHVGHTFGYAQQDMFARYKRMQGFNVFYPFGTDDNGLPTERLIEREKNVRAAEMPRQEFIKLCLETLEKEFRPKYLQTWKALGMSCDWDIFYTTINKHCQETSQESFIDLYNMKRAYRKRTPFMWCPECQTAIAQVELEDKTKKSDFVYMKFDTSIGDRITIATTRPELLHACVGISVNPKDERYKKFIGAKAKIPFTKREVRIQTDEDVDPDFGSGVLYRCSFGDMEDAEWVHKNNVKAVEIMNKDGTLNEQAGKYKGLKSKEARKIIIEDLKKEDRIKKLEPIQHVVNVHERCGTEIEILMTDQWFIHYLDLKKEFLQLGDKLEWHPKHMKNRYDNWVKGLKYDWCISRQRFFGVPFPVWYCKLCGEIIFADKKSLPVDPLKDMPKTNCPKCKSKEFIPEKDVFDTWATSSLTPQITASLFPKLFKKIYPMSLRPQGHDIISFWLFNTIVKSYLHEKKLPWKVVTINGWALDPDGKKMSKSKGNIVKQEDKINEYSADALRFWAASSKLGEDIPFKEKELATGQRTITKLWNASRFSMMNLKNYKVKKVKLLPFDAWQLSKLNSLIKNCTESFEEYEYFRTKSEVENFFWNTFCDNYLEIIKRRLYNPNNKQEKESAQFVLHTSIINILKLFAPIMPHITEELYQMHFKKYEKEKSIHITKWPKYDKKLINEKLEKEGEDVIDIISKARQFKTSNQKSLKEEIILTIPMKLKSSKFLQDLKAVTNAKEIKFGNNISFNF